MVVFLSQLNDLEIWGADVGNAYLEAYTDPNLCIIVGPEFKELQVHLLIMIKTLHGTRSGGARWHDRLSDILQELKFKPSKADPDVWMRPEPGGTCYEYIAVYVDDLAIAAKDPQAFCNELKKKYNLTLKGVGPLEYHLGCTYNKDPDGTLAADPRRYVNKILESYERMFKEKPRKSRPPLEEGDHPELDTSELCDDHQTKQFQTLIGQLQWLISLGRFDIAVHLLIMVKALYGTRSGGARWHDRLFDILQELKFKPSKADPDVWMRPEPGGTCSEYIAVYVDDLAIAAKDPQAFCNELKEKYNLKLKGVGPLEYHLGCTYKKDPDGTLAADPRKYVNKILESYERMFNEKPRKSRPPLEGGDHPELDTSELCDDHQTKQFQTLIGQLQWLISLGRFDIAVHVMSLSRFRAQPRKGTP